MIQILTSVEQQKEVYSRLDDDSKKRWSQLFENPDKPVFTLDQIAFIKGENK